MAEPELPAVVPDNSQSVVVQPEPFVQVTTGLGLSNEPTRTLTITNDPEYPGYVRLRRNSDDLGDLIPAVELAYAASLAQDIVT